MNSDPKKLAELSKVLRKRFSGVEPEPDFDNDARLLMKMVETPSDEIHHVGVSDLEGLGRIRAALRELERVRLSACVESGVYGFVSSQLRRDSTFNGVTPANRDAAGKDAALAFLALVGNPEGRHKFFRILDNNYRYMESCIKRTLTRKEDQSD